MKNYIKVSNSELKVMDTLLEFGDMATISEILNALNENGEKWAYQTVATFLKRLETKGLISSVKKNRLLYYYTNKEQEYYKAKNFVNINFGGSLKNFLTAFSNGDKFTKKELDDLREWFNNVDSE